MHQDRILTALLALVILPLVVWLAWRIEYFRLLFRLLVSESNRHGVLVAKLVSPPRTLFGRLVHRKQTTDRVGIVDANRRIKTMFGLEAVRRPDLNEFPRDLVRCVTDCLRLGVDSEKEINLSLGAETRHLVLSVGRVRLFGRFRRCVVAVTDITESIEADRQRNFALAEARHQHQLYATTVRAVHDAKTPLQTALLVLTSLKSDISRGVAGLPRDEFEVQRATMESSITEAVDNLNRCMFLANEELLGDPAHSAELRSAVQHWIDRIGHRYESRGFPIRNYVPGSLPPVMLHTRAFEILLQCACDNAVQWTPRNRIERGVSILGSFRNDRVILSIADNGVGMDEETRRRAEYEPGFTKRPMGSGQGLLIIHKSCSEHGAELSIESAPDSGTTMHVSFPEYNEVRYAKDSDSR